MSRYAVELSEAAEDQLADIWLKAPDRAAVNSAEVSIMRDLARDPIGVGEEVREGLYRYGVSPLTFYYSVDPALKGVEVDAIRYNP